MRRYLGAVAIAAASTAPLAAQEPLLLRNATVIDGRGGEPIPGQSVLIQGGRITVVGAAGSITAPAGTRAIDLTGKFLIPGLIDTHLHGPPDSAVVARRLEFLLRHGVTSARDMAGDAHVLGAVARVAAAASAPMARLHYSAFWAGQSFYDVDKRPIGSTQGKPPGTVPWFLAIATPADASTNAPATAATGAHAVKLYADLPPETFKAAVDAAHRRGLRALSHVAVMPLRPREVIAAGVDGVSHAALLVWEAAEQIPDRFHTDPHTNFGPIGPYPTVRPDDPRIVAVLDTLKARGIVLDATISTIENGISPEASEWTVAVTALARKRGVRISTGTDRPESPRPGGQPVLFEEIEMLVHRAGLTPLEAITAATLNGARAIGIDQETGTIEAGKVADLVILDQSPLDEIRRLRHPSLVIKGGVTHQAGVRGAH